METLKRRKAAPDAAADLLYLLTSPGGSAQSAHAALDKRRSFSVAFDPALGAYRWTFQEKRSSR